VGSIGGSDVSPDPCPHEGECDQLIESEVHRIFTYLSQAFWKHAIERAVRTGIQVFVALLSAGNFGLSSAPWASPLSTAAFTPVAEQGRDG
jgi:hypothetical protein